LITSRNRPVRVSPSEWLEARMRPLGKACDVHPDACARPRSSASANQAADAKTTAAAGFVPPIYVLARTVAINVFDSSLQRNLVVRSRALVEA